jgi:MscS family membrane protein
MSLFTKRFFCLIIAAAQFLAAAPAAEPAGGAEKTALSGDIVIKGGNITVITAAPGEISSLVTAKSGNAAAAPAAKDTKTGQTHEAAREKLSDSVIFRMLLCRDWEQFKSEVSHAVAAVVAWDGFEPWKIIYLFSGLIATVVLSKLSKFLVRSFVVKGVASKTRPAFKDMLMHSLSAPLSLFLASGGLLLSMMPFLTSSEGLLVSVIERALLAVCAGAVAWASYRLVAALDFALTGKDLDERLDRDDNLLAALLRKFLRIIVVVLSILFIGQNILGLNITALLAGAGVAGLAVAFAAQDTIANVFGSVMLILDRSFKVGDRVNIGGVEGLVENIGFRSIRVRTLNGHLITIPNKTAAAANIENVSCRPFLKIVSSVKLALTSSPDDLDKSLRLIHQVFDNHEGMSPELPPEIFVTSIAGAVNINIELWYHPGDYFKAYKWFDSANKTLYKTLKDNNITLA